MADRHLEDNCTLFHDVIIKFVTDFIIEPTGLWNEDL